MHHRHRRNRRGVALVVAALMIMAVMALAALAIDLSLVQLTRRQMQGAVNTAALEALRNDVQANGSQPNGPQPASELVYGKIFADPSGQQIAYGAGPYVPYSGGIPLDGSNLAASQYLPLPPRGSGAQPNGSSVSGPWLPPQLEFRATDQQGADIVRGQYAGDFQSHYEDSNYNRGDFIPDSGTPDSMLVRMRRTMEQPNDGLPPGATGGPPVPFLFGRGNPSLLYGGNRLLGDGIPVRATAIAQWTPALSIRVSNGTAGTGQIIGVGYADPNISGGLSQLPAPSQLPYAIPLASSAGQSLALTDLFWKSSTDQDTSPPPTPTWTTTQTPIANGIYATSQSATVNVVSAGTYQDPLTGHEAALVISPLASTSISPSLTTFSIVVGQAVAQSNSSLSQTPTPGLVPIVSLQNSSWLIVGFAYVGLAPGNGTATVTRYLSTTLGLQNYPLAQDQTNTPLPITVTHAVHNASATFGAVCYSAGETLPASASIAAALQARTSLLMATAPSTGALLPNATYLLSAPALVRTMAAPIPQN